VRDAGQRQRPVGELLRGWRERRRLSQLALSIQAEISARHLSFVETGRSVPSRAMIVHLAEELDIPLRERNHLLLAAGYAPIYAETELDAPRMSAVRAAVRQVLTGHEPYPAAAVDRAWNLVDANAPLALLTAGAAPELLEPPANALRISLHPLGMAPRIVNLGQWQAHLLDRLRRQVALTADRGLTQLYDELRGYAYDLPTEQLAPGAEPPRPDAIVIPLRLRHEGHELTFFSMVATFGTPLDITLDELAIESFFPADPETASVLQAAAAPGLRRQSSR
jgi:transcriptional regulator with XRE-family HTH domain